MLLGIDTIAAVTDAPNLIDVTHLSVFVKLAQAKQDVVAALLTNGRDARVLRQIAATLIDFRAQLHTVQDITPRLFDCIARKLDFVGQNVEKKAHELFSSLHVVAEACSESMADELDLEVHCNLDPYDAEGVFKVCTSAAAKVFKDTWSKLVQEHEIVAEITHMFAEQEGLTKLRERVDAVSSKFCDDEDTCCRCRNKVCELAVARAASRRLKEVTDISRAETRCDLIKKSSAIIETLERDIPSRLGVIVDRMSQR